jgi:hypothetical protein
MPPERFKRCLKESDSCEVSNNSRTVSHLIQSASLGLRRWILKWFASEGNYWKAKKAALSEARQNLSARQLGSGFIPFFMYWFIGRLLCSLFTIGISITLENRLASCTPTRMPMPANWEMQLGIVLNIESKGIQSCASSNALSSPKNKSFSARRLCCECRACRHSSTSRAETHLYRASWL